MPALLRGCWPDWIDFAVLLGLLLLCALGGGSAFPDTLSLLYVRPAAVVALVVFLLSPARIDWPVVRWPTIMLAVLAAIIGLQLLPLPPTLWLSLPGRGAYAAGAAAAGIDQPWRPLSLTPDLTMNSLAALVVPMAVLLGFGKISEEQQRWLGIGLVILCCTSATLGIAQFAGGQSSTLYLYKRTYNEFPVGLLANRNHQATLLALIFPALRVWTLLPAANRAAGQRRLWLALALGVLIVPVILATGSRAGMTVAVVSIAITALAFSPARGTVTPRVARLIRYGVPAALVLMVVLSYVLGRAASIERLSSMSTIEDDQRFQFAPVVVRIIQATFPTGTGFGSFDPVFRQYEPDTILAADYFNHAHNELLELAMTAGLPGLLLLLVFLGWWAIRLAGAWHQKSIAVRGPILLGAITVAILFASSLVDYPLRTPLLSAVFAIACGWLGTHKPTAKVKRVAMTA